MNNSNNNNVNIDDKISQLKKLTEEYDKMDNLAKIKNTDTYNNIIKERDLCASLVNEYKSIIHNVNNNKINIHEELITDDKVFTLLEEFNDIKKQINNSSVGLNESIDLYIKLNNVKIQLDSYFGNKKLQIIKL